MSKPRKWLMPGGGWKSGRFPVVPALENRAPLMSSLPCVPTPYSRLAPQTWLAQSRGTGSSLWAFAWALPSTCMPACLTVQAPSNLQLHHEAFLGPSLSYLSLCPISSTPYFMGPLGFRPRHWRSSQGAHLWDQPILTILRP